MNNIRTMITIIQSKSYIMKRLLFLFCAVIPTMTFAINPMCSAVETSMESLQGKCFQQSYNHSSAKPAGLNAADDEAIVIDGMAFLQTSDTTMAVTSYTVDGSNRYFGDIVIPADVTYKEHSFKVTSIGESAFAESDVANVSIPKTVKTIGNSAFNWCSKLESVTIPDGVTTIGNCAFSGCEKITSITFPNSVTSMGFGVFDGCSGITSFSVPEKITLINDNMFRYCSNLTNVTIPEGVKRIGSKVFQDCSSLPSITIPSTTDSLGINVFDNCTALKEINVNESNGRYCSIDGVLCNKAKNTLIAFPCGKTSSYTVPESIDTIESSAFAWCTSLTAITLPSGLLSIGDFAFDGCGLENVEIPGKVSAFGNGAFADCSSLKKVTIDNGVKKVGISAFNYCAALEEVNIPASVDSIGDNAFNGCSQLSKVSIEKGVSVIGTSAFDGCSALAEITLPVKKIGKYAFHSCYALAKVNMTDDVEAIGESAFESCTGLTSIVIPEKVNVIPDAMLSGCNQLNDISLHEGITSIGQWAFKETNISKLQIPNSVKTISAGAFSSCAELSSVSLPETIDTISDYAFMTCKKLSSIVIPSKVKYIGASSFTDCESIERFTVPSSVETVGEYAFSGCLALKSMTCLGTTPPSCPANAFDFAIVSKDTLYVPKDTKDIYATSEGWNQFIYFQETGTSDAINNMDKGGCRISADNNAIRIENCCDHNVCVSIYSNDGTIIYNGVATKGNNIIPVKGNSMFIIKCDGNIVKVLIK
jgi:hypothetical protein